MTDYVNEIYSYLRIMEKNQDIKVDYLAGQTVWDFILLITGLILKCQEILPKMRAVLVDWMVCLSLKI